MANKYFKNEFAVSGDVESVPDDSVNTLVSYETGYTPEYELNPDTDPNGNYIGRPRMNQLFRDITGNLKQWQDRGYPEFVADDGTGNPLSYPAGRIVDLAGVYYRANTTTNTSPPSVQWDVINLYELDGLGVNQTWQDVLGSRASGITYTNTTGKPISVSVEITGDVTTTLTVGGVIADSINGTTAGTHGLHAIVPDGNTYIITAGRTILAWAELR